MKEIRLNSVNWEHGMLLTPDHFLRQEQYMDSLHLWATRYLSPLSGLIGGGPRLPESERGAVRHDPIITLKEDSETISITVTQARGLTAGGELIEIDPSYPLRANVAKSTLAGIAEANIYIIADSGEKKIVDGASDEFNPQMKTERYPVYRISLQPQADEISSSIIIARLQRPPLGAGYERDSRYIPPCISLVSFSELTAAWRKIVEVTTALTQRYTELHRAMREFLLLFAERGLETDGDREAASFVERIVTSLHSLMYEILDPIQSPQHFFGYLRRFFHSAAVFLDLCPSVQQYYKVLQETGETEFIILMEQQRRILELTRTWQLDLNLANEARNALDSLYALHRLERAMEGKYVDFHVSPSLEAMNFVFDRGGKILYKMVAKPARLQGIGEDLTIYFSQLRLEGREKYRLILIGEQKALFEKGYRLPVEIKLNEGSGYRRDAIILTSEAKLDEQYNFDFDFEAPDVPTISDMRVTLQAHHPVRTALLYARHRFYSNHSTTVNTARPIEPNSDPIGPEMDRTKYRENQPSSSEVLQNDSVIVERSQRPFSGSSPQRPVPPRYTGDPRIRHSSNEQSAPWERQEKSTSPETPPRRRRLE